MKRSILRGLGILILITSALFIFPQVSPAAPASFELTPYQLAWVDEFNQATLNQRWHWVREDPALWSLSSMPGSLQIISSGSLHQASNNLENILLTSAPAGDFRLSTRVNTTPTENYHGAALYVYQDDDNFIELARIYVDGSYIGFRTETNGSPWGSYVATSSDDVLLRIVKEDDVYYGWFSEDNGASWNYVDQIEQPMASPQVGVSVRMGPTTTPLAADWDYFRIESYLEMLYLPLVQ